MEENKEDSIKFLSLKKLDNILINKKKLKKVEIINIVSDLRDEIYRFF